MGLWAVEVYEDGVGWSPCAAWTNKLTDAKFVALDAAIRFVLAERGLDLVRTEWRKPLGGGLHEFRLRHDEGEIKQMFGGQTVREGGHVQILLRVFVHFYGSKVVLLLGGYDKGRDPAATKQEREIKKARKILNDWRARAAAERKS